MSKTLKLIEEAKFSIAYGRRELIAQKRVFQAQQDTSYKELDTMERWIDAIEEELKKELNQEEE